MIKIITPNILIKQASLYRTGLFSDRVSRFKRDILHVYPER